MDQTYAETLESVYQAYTKSLDIDVALSLVPMSAEIHAVLLSDPVLTARRNLCDASVKESLVEQVRELANNALNEGVKLQALKELGRTLYPKRFKDSASTPSLTPLKRVNVPVGEWPDDFVAVMNEDLKQYVDTSDFPTESEFCYTRGITHKQLKKFLGIGLDLMGAKRQALMLKRGWGGDEAPGTFLTKLAANAGDFSLVDKHEVGGPNGEPVAIALIKRVIVDK